MNKIGSVEEIEKQFEGIMKNAFTILTPVPPDDITEALTVLSRIIYDRASEIDTDLRMEAYRILHKHKMLQPVSVDKRQPKARK